MGMMHNIQLGIARRIMADKWMTGIEVITQADGDIDTMIRKKLAALGICATIGMGKAGGADPGASGPYFEDVVFVIEVQEYVLQNRSPNGTRKPVLDVCERIASLLHHFEIPDGPSLYISEPGIVPAIITPPATSAYSVAVETSDGVYIDPAAFDNP